MKISTSILDCNDKVDAVLKLNRTNTSYIHIDVMDGKFVSGVHFQNIDELRGINRVSKYPMDIHLMMEEPISYIEQLSNMNIEFITVHLEIDKDVRKIFKKIKGLGYKVGLSIKPNTLVKEVEKYLDIIDMVLVMSVEPGMGGQKFMDSTIDRVKDLKELINKSGRNILIEVDGGINNETIKCLEYVDIAVVGSYIVKSDNFVYRVDNLLKCYNMDYSDEVKVKNVETYGAFSISLVIIGTFLTFVSFILSFADIGFVSFLYVQLFFIVGFLILALGMFRNPLHQLKNKNANEAKLFLNKKRLLYKILLLIGILPFVFMVCFSAYYAIFRKVNFILGIIVFGFAYWKIFLLSVLFIIVSIVRLNEIKRLS